MFVNITTISSKTSWGEDFGSHLGDEMWGNILMNTKKNKCSKKS